VKSVDSITNVYDKLVVTQNNFYCLLLAAVIVKCDFQYTCHTAFWFCFENEKCFLRLIACRISVQVFLIFLFYCQ